MGSRETFYADYLLVKQAAAIYPDFNSMSDMEKEAVFKQLSGVYNATANATRSAYNATANATRSAYKSTAQAARSGAAKVKRGAQATGDAYDYVGRRGAAWLESQNIPVTSAIQQVQTAGNVANASGPVAGVVSLGTGLGLTRMKNQAAHALKTTRATGVTKDRLFIRNERLKNLNGLVNEEHFSRIANDAADAMPAFYNAPGRFSPASWLDFMPGI